MAQKDDLRKEFLKMKREYTEKVRSKGINEFKKEKLNSKDVEMLVLKFQMGKYDSLIIYVDKDIKKIMNYFSKSNDVEGSILHALKNTYKSKVIFDEGTRNEIVIEFDGKETLEKYTKYLYELSVLLKTVTIERV